jgi:predicted transcriptional regulator
MKSNYKENFNINDYKSRQLIRWQERNKGKKSYFAAPTEIFALYKTRVIFAIDVRLIAYMYSCCIGGNAVKITKERIARRCGICVNTVAASVKRLKAAGLIEHIEKKIRKGVVKKFGTTTYRLKPLPESGFFLCEREKLRAAVTPKQFAIYLSACHMQNFEYDKFWNSYNDISVRLGFGKTARSEVMRLVKGLVQLGLLKKKVRKTANKNCKYVYVDNLYNVVDFAKKVLRKVWKPKSVWAEEQQLAMILFFRKIEIEMEKMKQKQCQNTQLVLPLPLIERTYEPLQKYSGTDGFPF